MRKITEDSIGAFFGGQEFNRQNMRVSTYDGGRRCNLYLHGNLIAQKDGYGDFTVHLSDCGWPTPTTFDRLNAILSALYLPTIYTEKGQPMIDGCDWLGYERIQVRNGEAYFG